MKLLFAAVATAYGESTFKIREQFINSILQLKSVSFLTRLPAGKAHSLPHAVTTTTVTLKAKTTPSTSRDQLADATAMKPVTRSTTIAATICCTNATTVRWTDSVPHPSATTKTINGTTAKIPPSPAR